MDEINYMNHTIPNDDQDNSPESTMATGCENGVCEIPPVPTMKASDIEGDASTMKYMMVDSLPIDNIDLNTIYLVPVLNARGEITHRDGYIYIHGWVKVETDDISIESDTTSEETGDIGEKEEEDVQDQEEDSLSEVEDAKWEDDSSSEPEDAEDEDELEEDDNPYRFSEELIEDGRKDFEKLIKIPYIELHSLLSNAKSSLAELEEMKETVDSIKGMSQDEYSAIVAAMDEATRKDYEGGVQEFSENYPIHHDKASFAVALIEAILEQYRTADIMSTAFISKSMVEAGQMRLEELDTNKVKPINCNLIKKRITSTISSYSDRTHFPMLFNKLRYPSNVLDIFKEFTKEGPEAALKYINAVFMSVFNDNNMQRFRNCIENNAIKPNYQSGSDETDFIKVMVFFMTYWLAKNYEKEYASGKCAEIKVFVMNAYDSDSSTKIYDLPAGSAYYFNVVYSIFCMLASFTSKDYSVKMLSKVMGGMADEFLNVLEGEYEAKVKEYPGKIIEGDTSISYMKPELIYDDLLIFFKKDPEPESEEEEEEIDESEEESEVNEEMANLKNQKAGDELVDLGNQSVDPTVIPEEVDNRGGDDEDEKPQSGSPKVAN